MGDLLERIKHHEGCRLRPYVDTTGHYTIGWGHKMESVGSSILADGITQDEADHLLDVDIEIAKNALSRLPVMVLNNCNDMRRGVLTEMCFQLGYSGVLKFKRMLAAIEQGNFGLAAVEMIDSLWYDQTPSRVEEMAAIMRSG